MSTKPTLENILAETTPQLTEVESARLFASVTLIQPVVRIASPYQFTFFAFKPMSYVALILVLLLGAGGTVAAAGSAKPGDLLFPIDRATEEVRLALASDGQKSALQNQFITERFTELQTILNEEKVATSTATSTDMLLLNASTTLLAASTSLQFTAKVFSDVTVVETVIGSSTPVYFTMPATSTEAIVQGLADRYSLPYAFVTAHLTIADQHRVSVPGDVGGTVVRVSGEARVANAIAVLAQQLVDQTDPTKREANLRALLDEVSSVHVSGRDDAPLRLDTARVKIDDNRTEVRTINERVHIEQKDGQVEIKVDHRSSGHGESGDDNGHIVSAPTATTSASIHESDDTNVTSEQEKDDDAVSFRDLGTASTTMPTGQHREDGGHEQEQESHGGHHGNGGGESDNGHDD
jgi:hypothetical protein